MPVRTEDGFIDKRCVSAEFFERLSRLQTMDPYRLLIAIKRKMKLTHVTSSMCVKKVAGVEGTKRRGKEE